VSSNKLEATTGALPALPRSLSPLRVRGQRLPRRSFGEGRLYAPSQTGYGSASHFWTRSSISGATRCLREGACARPPGCKSLRVRHFSRNVAQSLEHPAWDREAAGANPAIPTISTLPWPNEIRRSSSKRTDAGAIPAGTPLPGGVKVARRPVKPLVLVRVQVWQPICTDGWQRSNAPVLKTE
jgi:hypothetical protein